MSADEAKEAALAEAKHAHRKLFDNMAEVVRFEDGVRYGWDAGRKYEQEQAAEREAAIERVMALLRPNEECRCEKVGFRVRCQRCCILDALATECGEVVSGMRCIGARGHAEGHTLYKIVPLTDTRASITVSSRAAGEKE